MKLKDTKYLLPTTEGRLHKELSYLISLHENKMNKSKIKTRLDELENKVNEMSHALSMMYGMVESSNELFKDKLRPTYEVEVNENDGVESISLNTKTDDKFPFVCDIYIPESEPITSTTLKTPNEWLKLMSEEEVRLWKDNRSKADGWGLDMDKEYTFADMILYSFHWLTSTQGADYWNNLSNRYNN